MAQTNFKLRVVELEVGIAQAFAELDKADGSRIGLQEAIDASQSIMRDAYGESLDADSLEYSGESEDDFDEDEDEESEGEMVY